MLQRDIIEGLPSLSSSISSDFDSDTDDSADRVNDGIAAMRANVERIGRTRHLIDVARETGVAPDDWSQLSRHRQVPDIDTGRMKNERLRP